MRSLFRRTGVSDTGKTGPGYARPKDIIDLLDGNFISGSLVWERGKWGKRKRKGHTESTAEQTKP
jgi:hypothetical protein